jgi:hypothetical protein
MLGQLSIHVDLARWEFWTIPVIGLASAGFAIAVGTALFRARRRLPPVSKTDMEPSDPFLHGSATERRAAARRSGRQVRVLVSDAEAKAIPYEAWILDRSIGGLGLIVHRQIALDTILSVRTSNSPETIPWVQVRVVCCQGEKDHWELGCQFLKTPSWNIMLHFG